MSMMASVQFKFTGKTALVTGAGRGIGRAVAKALLSTGATVYALDKVEQNLDNFKAVCPVVRIVVADLLDWEGTKSAIEAIGPIDLLVNNAGVSVIQSFLEVDQSAFDLQFGINVKAIITVSQVVARGLIARGSRGSIVNVSSVSATRALPDHTVYCGSKGAVDQLTRVMALELGPHQVRVNAVRPTIVMTDMGKMAWSDAARSDPMKVRHPLGRFAEEEDVVNAILYLLSDSASMINGTFLNVDGGFLVT